MSFIPEDFNQEVLSSREHGRLKKILTSSAVTWPVLATSPQDQQLETFKERKPQASESFLKEGKMPEGFAHIVSGQVSGVAAGIRGVVCL